MKKLLILLLMIPFYVSASMNNIAINNVHINQTATGMHELSGVAINKSNIELKNVFVTYALYKDGYKIAELVDGVGLLKPLEKWKFSIISPYVFDRYELQSIKSY